MVEVRYQTLGEAFIEDLELAKRCKESLFEFLLRTIKKDNPSDEIHNIIRNITESESLINYYDVLARLQIERNSKTINNIRTRLSGIHTLQNSGDIGYVKIMQKKLNLLSSMTIGLKEHLYMVVNCYIRDMRLGSIQDFKEDFLEYLGGSQYGVGLSTRSTRLETVTAVV